MSSQIMSTSSPGVFSRFGIFHQSVFSDGASADQTESRCGRIRTDIHYHARQADARVDGRCRIRVRWESGGGATGDIYGSFIDSAMGKALASSKSMSQLNKMINRELSGPRHPVSWLPKLEANAINSCACATGKCIDGEHV